MVRGYKLDGFLLKPIDEVDFTSCAKQCRLRPACLSLNYNRQALLCEINSEAIGNANDLTFNNKWVYSNVSTLRVIDLGTCINNSCTVGQVCIENDSGFECKNEGTNPTLLQIDNGTVKGNLNDDGSKIVFECSSPFVLFGPRISTFSENTGWGDMPICERPCPAPNLLTSTILQIMDATIITESGQTTYTRPSYGTVSQIPDIMTNSYITLHCTRAAYGTTSVKLTCNAGTWTFSTDCSSNGLACDLDTNCNSADDDKCISDICHCAQGTSYSYTLHSCVTRCPGELAATFTRLNNIRMNNGNHIFNDFLTYKMCRGLCLNSDSCLSFEYGQLNGWVCVIREIVADDYPDDMVYWSSGQFYQQDCL